MNRHTYLDRDSTPAGSAVCTTLSDGSHVWDLILTEKQIGCIDELHAKRAEAEIAEVLRKWTMAKVETI